MAPIGHEDVRGLDVAMNDPLGVRGIERVGDLNTQLDENLEIDRTAADAMLQRLAFEPLHHDEMLALVLADVVDGADVRVVERGGGAGFALKPLDGLWIAGQLRWQKLQRDASAEANVFRLINHTHPAAAKLVDDAIVGDGLADHDRPQSWRPALAGPDRVSVRWIITSRTVGPSRHASAMSSCRQARQH
jgi:hypothetical protein